ncbi:MAG TPA: acyl-CoA dehydratase activase [Geomonas sp.]|nr:acyl-CoA dehydratase activase [Geomonas sp.]
MIAPGIDIGSRYIKSALVADGRLVSFDRMETGCDPLAGCRLILGEVKADRVMATGYGRHLLEVHGDIPAVTEIKAFARGARHFFPASRTVIDIGGQDTKVIALSAQGRVIKFEMNDRCAAGTGKFLEVMARSLGYDLEAFGALPDEEGEGITISSMCTVFAESEVVSLIARGAGRSKIAAAIHRAVAARVAGMVKRIPAEEEIVFAGGCARGSLLRSMLERSLGKRLLVPKFPEITGALGAALCAGGD